MRERHEAYRDARLVVIASEGKDTEKIYFRALAKKYANPRVHVHILNRAEGEENVSIRHRSLASSCRRSHCPCPPS